MKNNNEKIYLIADTHFSHKNIIKYCDRPYNNVKEMNQSIIDNWNKTVKKNDIVYHLGDFTIDNHNIKSIVDRLNGKIYMIRGNHDRKSIVFYNSAGLEILPTQTKLEKYKIIMSHKPLMNNQIPEGYINIHGHIHNSKLDESIYDKKKHICISVELINYTPIEINKIC